jgi:hypothetical protein
MKQSLLICIFLLIGSLNVQAQFFKKLDKGLRENSNILCSAADSSGNLLVAYSNAPKDSVVLRRWNVSTKKWSHFRTLPIFNTSYMKAVYKNDSLYMYGGFMRNGVQRPGLYYIGNTGSVYKGTVTFEKQEWAYVTTLNVMHGHLIIVGFFDSARTDSSKIAAKHFALFDGKKWKSTGFSAGQSAYLLDAEQIGDTLLTCFYDGAGDKIHRYVYPSQWNSIPFPRITRVTCMTTYKNRFLIIKRTSDTMLSPDSIFFITDTIVGTRKSNTRGLYLGEAKEFRNRLIVSSGGDLYEYKADTLKLLYKGPLSYNFFGLEMSRSHLYHYNMSSIIYKNTDYGNFVELDLDSLPVFGWDTIVGNAFWDRNSNYVRDAGDRKLTFTGIGSVTYQKKMVMDSSGYFTDIVPDYNDVVYRLTQFRHDTCLMPPFSGDMKTSNTTPGVTRDSIVFPLRRSSLQLRNLEVKCAGAVRARLMDTITLRYEVFSRDCDSLKSSAKLVVSLHPDLQFISSQPTLSSRTGNEINFQLNNIYPFKSEIVEIDVVYPVSKYSAGQYITHRARIEVPFSEDTTDNSDSIVQKLVYSYDPNEKHSFPEGVITNGLTSIRYHIDFQNLGNDDAYKVTVVDTLNVKMPVYEFRMLWASHPYKVTVSGKNVVTWEFNNINLRPKSVDEAKSKGFVIFEAKVKGNLRQGDSIRNRAHIYFDYNSPVITNFSVILRDDDHIGLPTPVFSGSFTLYPNPSNGIVYLSSSRGGIREVSIYDSRGALIRTVSIEEGSPASFPTLGWSPGIYIARGQDGETVKFMVR